MVFANSPSPQTSKDFIVSGDDALRQRHLDEAREYYQKALDVSQKLRKTEREVEALLRLGALSLWEDRYSAASEYYERALNAALSTEDSLDEGYCLKGLGDVYARQALASKALKTYKEALNHFELSEKKEKMLVIGYRSSLLASIGKIHADLGRYLKALDFNQDGLSLLKTHAEAERRYAKLRGDILQHSGSIHSRLGDYNTALEDLEQAQVIFSELNDSANMSETLTGIGGIHEEWGRDDIGNYLKALDMYREALDIRKQNALGNSRQTATLLNNIGKVLDRLGRDTQVRQYHEQALNSYEEALALYREIQVQGLESKTLNNLGEAYLHLSAYEKRKLYLEKSLMHFSDAEQIQRRLKDRRRRWITLDNIGRIYEIRGDFTEALEFYKESIEEMESIIDDAGVAELKISLGDQIAELYQRTILLLLHMGEARQAFEFSERARARAFLDLLGNERHKKLKNVPAHLLDQREALQSQLSELEFRLREIRKKPDNPGNQEQLSILKQELTENQHEYESLLTKIKIQDAESVTLLRVQTLQLQEIQVLLASRAPRTTLLSYVVTPEKSIAFILSKDRFEAVELAVKQRDLEKLIKAFRQDRHLGEPQPEMLKKLHARLVAPLEKYLGTPVIGVIPHDVLHYLPFAALTDGEHFLGEEYTLFRLPAASVLKHLHAKTGAARKSLLAMANPQEFGLSELPGAGNEVHSIGTFYGRYYRTAEYVSDDEGFEAVESLLKEQAGEHQLLHVASHGELNPENPLHSRLILSADEQDDGRLHVHEVYDLELEQTELVVLSACDTQLGKRSKGDDIVGLTRAFLYAGAPSVIASLWQVDDRATLDFMKTFYLQLASRRGPADALRATRRIMRRDYPHPYFWAGFVLTGLP